jgi:hypothetical protein
MAVIKARQRKWSGGGGGGGGICGARVLPKVCRRSVLPRTYYIFIISLHSKDAKCLKPATIRCTYSS